MSVTQAELVSVASPSHILRERTPAGILQRCRNLFAAELQKSRDRRVLQMIPTEVGRETGARC